MDSQVLINAVTKATQTWTKQRKAEEREKSRALRRREALIPSYRLTIKEAAWKVMQQAYLKASAGNTLPAHARQIMYPARGPIQSATGQRLDDQYFTQTLLPDYLMAHPTQTRNWDVVFDARGHFQEPHTDREIALGTLPVRTYLDAVFKGAQPDEVNPEELIKLWQTCGPQHRFGAVLFIEKEGFLPLFRKVRLAERYDLAIMSTKGMSNTAARLLVDQLCGRYRVPLLILRDFDKAGFSIAGTLQRDTRRYEFSHAFPVIDLGLRLADVEAQGLEAEEVIYSETNPASNLRENGATLEEIQFLCQSSNGRRYRGKRVELNAFTSDQLIHWIEGKLEACGIQKVIPDTPTLETAYRRSVAQYRLKQLIECHHQQIEQEVAAMAIPDDLTAQIQACLADERTWSWDQAIAAMVQEGWL